MSVLDALTVRDLVALVVIASRTIREGIAETPAPLVDAAFAVADEFVDRSESQWAAGARENHAAGGSRGKRNGPKNGPNQRNEMPPTKR